MIVGQTMFSVLKGTEHRAEAALRELVERVADAPGHTGHRVLRSFGMSPLASALCVEGRESDLNDAHYVFETRWVSVDAHDEFYASEAVQQVYDGLGSVLRSGPFEVLYEIAVMDPEHDGVTV